MRGLGERESGAETVVGSTIAWTGGFRLVQGAFTTMLVVGRGVR